MSLFTDALKGLLDDSNLFSREEWAEYLFIKVINGTNNKGPHTIEEWLREESLPKPHDLSMIVLVIERSSDTNKEPLVAFNQMSALPARTVSKFGKRMLPTVFEYMHRPLFCDLANRLAKLWTIEEQEALLEKEYPE